MTIATGNSTAVVRAAKSKLALALDAKQDTILSVLNKRLDLQYFLSTALLHVSESEHTLIVAQQNPTSFVKAVVKAAEFGLSFSKGLAYLVPFKDSVVFIAGYQGLVQVMLRGQTRIHDIRARMVYENEVFEHLEGTNPQLVHKPLETPEERGAMRGAYAVAFFRDGNLPHPEYMPMCDLDKRREAAKKRNKGKESQAWDDWAEEMYLRPPVRKLFKFLPQTEEGQKIMAYEDELWGYDKADVVEVAHHGDRTRQLSDKLRARTTQTAAKPEPEEANFEDVPPEPETVVPDVLKGVPSEHKTATEVFAEQTTPTGWTQNPPIAEVAAAIHKPLRPNDTPPPGQTKEQVLCSAVQDLLSKLNRREVTMARLRAVASEIGIKNFGVPQNLTEEEARAILEKL